jgi:hypothetical protein
MSSLPSICTSASLDKTLRLALTEAWENVPKPLRYQVPVPESEWAAVLNESSLTLTTSKADQSKAIVSDGWYSQQIRGDVEPGWERFSGRHMIKFVSEETDATFHTGESVCISYASGTDHPWLTIVLIARSEMCEKAVLPRSHYEDAGLGFANGFANEATYWISATVLATVRRDGLLLGLAEIESVIWNQELHSGANPR